MQSNAMRRPLAASSGSCASTSSCTPRCRCWHWHSHWIVRTRSFSWLYRASGPMLKVQVQLVGWADSLTRDQVSRKCTCWVRGRGTSSGRATSAHTPPTKKASFSGGGRGMGLEREPAHCRFNPRARPVAAPGPAPNSTKVCTQVTSRQHRLQCGQLGMKSPVCTSRSRCTVHVLVCLGALKRTNLARPRYSQLGTSTKKLARECSTPRHGLAATWHLRRLSHLLPPSPPQHHTRATYRRTKSTPPQPCRPALLWKLSY